MSDNALPDIGAVSTATIDGLNIRYARNGKDYGTPILLTAPWPESIYSFRNVVPRLAQEHPLIAVDLPGFGRSESRPDVMAPEAMSDFVIKLLAHFDVKEAHAVAPDVGALAVLFAAHRKPDLFKSLALGGAAVRTDLAAGALKDMINSPPGAFAAIDGAKGVGDYLVAAAKLTPAPIIEDFKAASAGRRLEDAVQFVRGYIPDLPKLEKLLPDIKTPVLIVAGKSDPIVPAANGQFLAERLPHNRYVLLEAEHRIWEEAANEYAIELASWIGGGYQSGNW
ncbi:alpha/beta hydrolase [Mesorhizobium sp. B2-4-17]|uniref:alpha/beta fold hydrolase n=1 Tax=Mesorhizobium sp. B2-4-17 TaxID=2589932 RepID=UPI00112648E2|nr:alpha/beta hydrolase [Mesorhizobium sp. B2-4-17]TPK78141.1 alpha/beta hydrolase [Mesorhizobium sp. B2-4-17]